MHDAQVWLQSNERSIRWMRTILPVDAVDLADCNPIMLGLPKETWHLDEGFGASLLSVAQTFSLFAGYRLLITTPRNHHAHETTWTYIAWASLRDAVPKYL